MLIIYLIVAVVLFIASMIWMMRISVDKDNCLTLGTLLLSVLISTVIATAWLYIVILLLLIGIVGGIIWSLITYVPRIPITKALRWFTGIEVYCRK